MSSRDMADFLKELKNLPAVDTDEAYAVSYKLRDKLGALYKNIKNNPALLSDQVLDDLKEIALSAPYSESNPDIDGGITPVQNICLYAVSLFHSFAQAFPEKTEAIINCLENIGQNSMDQDIRTKSISQIWVLGFWRGQNPHNRLYAVAALERQGAKNSDPFIRIEARDRLLAIGGEYKEFMPRAIAAQVKGTDDADPGARARAFAMLRNRGVSPSCSDEEARSLLSVFEKAASDNRSSDEGVQYWVDRGSVEIGKRLKEGPKPYKFP